MAPQLNNPTQVLDREGPRTMAELPAVFARLSCAELQGVYVAMIADALTVEPDPKPASLIAALNIVKTRLRQDEPVERPAPSHLLPPEDADELSPGQIGALLGVSPTTVAHWIDSGKLPGRRQTYPSGASKRLAKLDDVNAFMVNHPELTRKDAA